MFNADAIYFEKTSVRKMKYLGFSGIFSVLLAGIW